MTLKHFFERPKSNTIEIEKNAEIAYNSKKVSFDIQNSNTQPFLRYRLGILYTYISANVP